MFEVPVVTETSELVFRDLITSQATAADLAETAKPRLSLVTCAFHSMIGSRNAMSAEYHFAPSFASDFR